MNDFVTLAHGAGGKQTSELIDKVFKAHFDSPEFTADDAATFELSGGRYAFTTDGFIVSPYEFPGGNIGKLSIQAILKIYLIHRNTILPICDEATGLLFESVGWRWQGKCPLL